MNAPGFFTRRGAVRHAADRSDAEKRLDARDARLATYKRETKAADAALVADVPEWRDFRIEVRGMAETGGAAFCAWLGRQEWLLGAERPLRMLALRAIDRQCDRIRLSRGLEPLDDPVEGGTVFFKCKGVLGL